MRPFRPQAFEARLRQLLALCGEDPSASFAAQYDALPLWRDLTGWAGIRADGALIFLDEGTGRVVTDLPPDVRERALSVAREKYGDLWG